MKTKIPGRLKNFNFVLIDEKADGKKPKEAGWQKKDRPLDNPVLQAHLKKGFNYGIRGGSTSPISIDGKTYFLVVVDFDTKKFQDKIMPLLPKTFSTTSGSKKNCEHLWFASDNDKSFKIKDENKETLCDVIAEGKQIIGPGSKHEDGTTYKIVADIDFAFIPYSELEAVLKPHDAGSVKLEMAAPSSIKDYTQSEQTIDNIPMKELLDALGVDTSKNPTACPLHSSKGKKCLSWTDTVLHCFHCQSDNAGWNKFSFVREVKKLSDKETFEWLQDKFGTRPAGDEFVSGDAGGAWVKYRCRECGVITERAPNKEVLCKHETDATKPKTYFVGCDPVGYVDEAAPEQIMEIVKSPDYGERLIKETDKRIVGEAGAKKVIIIGQFGGRLVINAKPPSSNILFSEESGAGKDYNAVNTLKLLGAGFWDHKTRFSEKALSYYHPADREPFFNWDGWIIYCEDASNSFLNSDTVKVFMTGGSNIAIVKDGYLKHLKINGTPSFLITSATAEPNKELNRRISSKGLDSSQEQTEKIMKFQSKVATEGAEDYDQDLIDSSYLLSRVTVELPFARELLETFPKTMQSRTNFDRLLDFIKANAALHQYSREWKNKNTILANREDLKSGLEVFMLLYPQRATSLTHAQQKLVDYLSKINSHRSASEIFRESGHFYYSQVGKLIDGLRSLAGKGFVDISEGERGFKTVDLYKYIPDLNPVKIGKDTVSTVSTVSIVSIVNKVSSKKKTAKKPLTKVTKVTPLPAVTQLSQLNTNEFAEALK